MKTLRINRFDSLLAVAIVFASASPAFSQEFLTPIASQPATFLTPATAEAIALQNIPVNHSSNELTGPGAFKGPVPQGRAYQLPGARTSLLAPQSVNSRPIPSGSYSFGFPKAAQSIAAGAPNYGQALPLVSTSSVDLNVVNCPFLTENYAPGQYDPYAVDSQLLLQMADGTMRTIDFQETQAESTSFLQMSEQDANQ